MTMSRKSRGTALLALVFLALVGACEDAPATAADGVPDFEVDPTWPRTLPNGWILGTVTALHVDSRNHVWVVHQTAGLSDREIGAARDPPIAACCVPAPPVLELGPGHPERSGGSNAPDLLGGPAAMYVVPETGELFVADGYRNRRVVVFDAGTGEYLRHWGAYGERPDDETGEAADGRRLQRFTPRTAGAPEG